jgi:hypothetical protein
MYTAIGIMAGFAVGLCVGWQLAIRTVGVFVDEMMRRGLLRVGTKRSLDYDDKVEEE